MLLLNAPYFGSERLMVRTASLLRSGGADVLVATCNWEFGGIRRELQWNGVAYTDIVMRGSFTRRGGMARAIGQLWEALRSALRVRNEARTFRPTHIVIPDELNFLYALPLLLARGSASTVYVPSNVPDEARATRSGAYRWFLRRVVGSLVDVVIANSEFTARAFRRRLPADAAVAVVPCCLPAREHGASDAVLDTIDPTRFNIVYVGQLASHKGADLLVDAAIRLADRYPDMNVFFAGPGDDRSEEEGAWRKQVIDRGLEDRVRFLGPVRDVPRLLTMAALHVMPSRCDESFGLVVLEAKAAGVPSVVFPVGALPELVTHEVDGFVCRDVSVDALTEGLRFFLDAPQQVRTAGACARVSADRYSFDRFEDGWQTVLERARAARGN
jgi:glycosyltransferase involved in cell wall biosynthesis